MKKTFAMILSLAMVLTLAVGLFTFSASAAEDVKATEVTVTPASGDVIVLDAGNKTAKDGQITFDPATAKVVLNNLSGVKKIVPNGSVTFEVKGTNTVENDTANAIYANIANGGSFTIVGDGTLNLKAAGYVLCSQTGSILIGGSVKLNAEATGGADGKGQTVIHTAADGRNSTVTIQENAEVSVNGKGNGVYLAGVDIGIFIKDNAVLNADVTGDAIRVDSNQNPQEGETPKAVLEVSGKAKITSTDANCGFRVAADKAANSTAIATFKDEAVVDVKARGQVLYVRACQADSSAYLNVTDKVKMSLTNTGTYNAVQVNGKAESKVNITTTSEVSLRGNRVKWGGGAFAVTDAAKSDILIKDTPLTIVSQSNAAEDVVIGLELNGSEGTFTVAGNAKVNITAKHESAEAAMRRAHGIFLNPKWTMTIQDNAQVNTTGDTASNHSGDWTSSGLAAKQANVIVKDNAVLAASGLNGSVAAIMLQGNDGNAAAPSANLTIEGKAQVIANGGRRAAIYMLNPDNIANKIDVKGGSLVAASGSEKAPAVIHSRGLATELSVADKYDIKSGSSKDDAVKVTELSKTDTYLFIGPENVAPPSPDVPTNPGTSDLAVALIASMAVLSALAAAAVVIRKRVHG